MKCEVLLRSVASMQIHNPSSSCSSVCVGKPDGLSGRADRFSEYTLLGARDADRPAWSGAR